MKQYQSPYMELLAQAEEDILTVSLSGYDDGEKAPEDWFVSKL